MLQGMLSLPWHGKSIANHKLCTPCIDADHNNSSIVSRLVTRSMQADVCLAGSDVQSTMQQSQRTPVQVRVLARALASQITGRLEGA